jgi:uncharacterized repeat protein (TIGR03803 family)
MAKLQMHGRSVLTTWRRVIEFTKIAGMMAAVCGALLGTALAQTYTTIASFDVTNGWMPSTPLVQGVDGNLYGTTPQGGTYKWGNVFKVTPTGNITSLYGFCLNCADGFQPETTLVVGVDGNLYGTTTGGGADCAASEGAGCGTIFKITPAGKLTTVYSFCATSPTCADGASPWGSLVLGTDGNFYGTTHYGGASGEAYGGGGTVFKMTPDGALTTLYSFCLQENCPDGNAPDTALVESEGKFYGATYDGGALSCPFFNNGFGCGTIFSITPQGELTTLYSFATDAGLLGVPLVQASNGKFYGTSDVGGTAGCSYGCGTVFDITQAGDYTLLYSFCSDYYQNACVDGAYPTAPLVRATDGNLYGTTSTGGYNEDGISGGTIFSITPEGTLTTLWVIGENHVNATNPNGGVIQATNGSFYGTTELGGTDNQGTIFEFSTGLGPFVETVPTGGKLGAKVLILGNDLSETTSVSFNGTAAAFEVVSETEITATVPAGAETGEVEVTTPKRILKSNVKFMVTP